MSQSPPGYDFQDAYAPEPRSGGGGGGCMKGCMIAGVILLVIAVLIGAGIWWLGRQLTSGVTRDPQEISKRLQERYPTAKIPAGYEGKVGMRIKLVFEMDLMVFTKGDAEVGDEGQVFAGDSLMFMSMNVPGAKQEDIDRGMQGMNQGEVVVKRPYTVKAGEYEFKASYQKMKGRNNEEHPQIVVPLGGGAVVVMQGTGEEVDEAALKEFLLSIAKDVPAAKKAGEKELEKKEPEKKKPAPKDDEQDK
jgi:hypothetical protein